MGGAQSSMGVSRETLLKSSQPMRLIADAALRVMFERITPKDLLDLSNPTTCNKYVLVISGAFDQYFRSIDVMPVMKGKPATIYFQRSDILTGTAPGTSEGYKKMRQEVCVLLGYFFKRFFQIYAALALSVFDSENIRQASGVFGLLGGPAALGQPGRSVYGQPGLAGKVFGPGQSQYVRGGAGTLEEPYALLNPYISATPTKLVLKQKYATVTGPELIGYKFEKADNLYLIKSESGYYVGLKSPFTSSVNFMVRITIRSVSNSDDKRIYFSDAYKDGEPLAITKYNEVQLTITPRDGLDSWKVEMPASLAGRGVTTALKAVATHIYTKGVAGTTLQPIRPSDIERKAERDVDKDYYRGERTGRTERGDAPRAYGATEKAPADLAGIVAALEKTKPVAHCVARSLQLLQLDALGPASARQGQSFICNVKFLVPESAADSIPRPGEKLSKSPGLASLEALYQVYQNGKVGLPEGSAEYINFLRTMEALFQGQGKGTGAKTLAGITSQRDGDVCKSILPAGIKDRQGTTIPLAGKGLEAAQKRVKELWGIHMAHVKEVDKLFAAMFSISGGNQIGVNPKIVAAGLPGLDALAAKSREILTNYYVGCEKSYRTGVDEIIGTMPAVAAVQPGVVGAPGAGAAAALRPVGQPALLQRAAK
jgi:hypothetical protein